MHPVRHLKTINEHRRLVRRYCFKIGLYRQGLMHDLSKYSPAEFIPGAKYYTGKGSPIARERKDKGISRAWLHHKGKNRHHPEHWIDYVVDDEGKVGFGPNPMPLRYIAEMFCDSIAASRVYLGDRYTDSAPLERFLRDNDFRMMHPDSSDILEKMFTVLSEQGEEAAISYVRKLLGKKAG